MSHPSMKISDIKLKVASYLAKKDAKMNTRGLFQNTVIVQHGDGSLFILANAETEYKTYGTMELLLVWTEHCGYFYFFMTDLERWNILKRA